MGFKVQIILEKDGKKATLATVENIDVVEQVADDQKATFRFHVEGATTQTLGGGAVLMVLDKIPAIKKIFDTPKPQTVTSAAPSAAVIVTPITLPEPVKDQPNVHPDASSPVTTQ
jgi:hypothetical protein